MLALASRALCRRGSIIGTAMTPAIETAEKRDDEIDAVGEQQQGARSPGARAPAICAGEGAGAAVEFGEGDRASSPPRSDSAT